MELSGFFSALDDARAAVDILQRTGYNVESATIVTGEYAKQSFDRHTANERWKRAISGALGCGALSLILAAIMLPPAPSPFPWLVFTLFVTGSALLGAVGGAILGTTSVGNTVLLELRVPKDHLHEATHILSMAGARFVSACSVPNPSVKLAGSGGVKRSA